MINPLHNPQRGSDCCVWKQGLIALLVVLLCGLTQGYAQDQTEDALHFTADDPVVYEDTWDVWPYSFLEDGKPTGYRVDLMRMIFEELGMPYEIKLKDFRKVLNDLKSGKADVMIGLKAPYHDKYGQYGGIALNNVDMVNTGKDAFISTGRLTGVRNLTTNRLYVTGGADISLEVMNVVVSTECTYHDVYCGSEVEYGQLIGTPARFKTAKNLVEKALEVNKKESSNTVVSGLIVTGDWFVDSQEKMRSILEKFPDAKAVDMESCAIAHTCHLYQIPFISFRIISDIPLKDNKASQYFDFWSRMAEGSFNVTKRFLELL